MDRLQKVIAHAGVTSRRKAEELILAGRVSVNGEIVTEPGTKADPHRDHIRIDGEAIGRAERPVYLAMNKPRGVVSTLSDPEGRPTIADFLKGARERLYPVGRLDFNSEGLILLTNDGELAYRIMHASTGIPKTYLVKVSGRPGEQLLAKLRAGVYLDGRRTAPAQIRWLNRGESFKRLRGRTSEENPWLEVILHEGRQNQIRRMFEGIGHRVEKLRRVRIGPLQLGDLQPGALRELSPAELAKLRRAASGKAAADAPSRPGRTPRAGARTPRRDSNENARPPKATRGVVRSREKRA